MSTVYTSLAALEGAVYSWLDPMMIEQIVWSEQKAPAPASAYMALKFTTLAVAEGNGYERLQVGSNRTLVQRRQATLNIQAFGVGAVERLWSLKTLINLESSQAVLVSANLALLREEDVQDISAVLDTQIQARASMDLIIGYTRSDVDGTNWIQTVEVQDLFGDTHTIS